MTQNGNMVTSAAEGFGDLFQATAPPPPPLRRRHVSAIWSDDEVRYACEQMVRCGFLGVPCDSAQDAKVRANLMGRTIMGSRYWVPQLGAPRAPWITRRVVQDDQGQWWGYVQVEEGSYVGHQVGGAKGICKVDASGVRNGLVRDGAPRVVR